MPGLGRGQVGNMHVCLLFATPLCVVSSVLMLRCNDLSRYIPYMETWIQVHKRHIFFRRLEAPLEDDNQVVYESGRGSEHQVDTCNRIDACLDDLAPK